MGDVIIIYKNRLFNEFLFIKKDFITKNELLFIKRLKLVKK